MYKKLTLLLILASLLSHCGFTPLHSSKKNINFSIYPNPAVESDNFRITSDLAINEVNVYNILSERVICTDKNIFSAQKLTKGTYIVNVLFQNGSSGTSKLIIK